MTRLSQLSRERYLEDSINVAAGFAIRLSMNTTTSILNEYEALPSLIRWLSTSFDTISKIVGALGLHLKAKPLKPRHAYLSYRALCGNSGAGG